MSDVGSPRRDRDGDERMGRGTDSEGSGDDLRPGASEHDSSEEEDDNPEEARRVAEGFIVDEEEDEEEFDGRERKRRRKRRRKERRQSEDSDNLDEEDLELLEENTGQRRSRTAGALKRLQRRRTSRSPSADEDDVRAESPPLPTLATMFDDIRNNRDFIEDDDDIGDFIEDDEEEGGDDEDREQRRRARRKEERERRGKFMANPELVGIDKDSWDEIFEVFGDGTDYDWALDLEDEEEKRRGEIKSYTDIFEPSEIRARLLTREDDEIRTRDVPERMQLSTPALSTSSTVLVQGRLSEPFDPLDIDAATAWVTLRVSPALTDLFLSPESHLYARQDDFRMAVKRALELLLLDQYEVPFIHAHRRDLVSFFDPAGPPAPVHGQEHHNDRPAGTSSGARNAKQMSLLSRNDLWAVHALAIRFRALNERIKALREQVEKLGISDKYLEDHLLPEADSPEVVADVLEWLNSRYAQQIRDSQAMEDGDGDRMLKRPSHSSAYERAKKTIMAKLAKEFGISADELALNFTSASGKLHFPVDPDEPPTEYAQNFVTGEDDEKLTPYFALNTAKMILATEIGRDPLLRKQVRERFRAEGTITVTPTERGLTKIDEQHPYYNFKYLRDKRVSLLATGSTQFLSILQAESEHLVKVDINLPKGPMSMLVQLLGDAITSDSFSAAADEWNELRREIVKNALDEALLPHGKRYIREWLREEQEDFLAKRCADRLSDRVDVAPFAPPDWEKGETPAVLAVSSGQGDPKKDAIMAVFLDEGGRFRERLKIDNLADAQNIEDFKELLLSRKPQVVVVGGLSVRTHDVFKTVRELVNRFTVEGGENAPAIPEPGAPAPQPMGMRQQDEWGMPIQQDPAVAPQPEGATPVIFVHDDVARIYQHSKRAEEEFGELPLTGKYCVGLARYAQSPLNEYAALGEDIAAITFDPQQRLLPRDKLIGALERALVNVVNDVGVDVNQAVQDAYYQHLLQFVSGFGPRKAQGFVKQVAARGGYLVNRDELAKSEILGYNVFMNAAGFLRIREDPESEEALRKARGTEDPDPLDSTRIHPEDYELARKMAADALELDEEDIAGQHPSQVVGQLMDDDSNESKLDELNLDDYAVNLLQTRQEHKRATLDNIRTEILQPFGERRDEFAQPGAKEVFTMLTGETEYTLSPGVVVPAQVMRTQSHIVKLRLDSGVDAFINIVYLADQQPERTDAVVKKGQTIQGMVLNIDYDKFTVELSSRPQDLALDSVYRKNIAPDEYYDMERATRDKEDAAKRKKSEAARSTRIIEHPNFANINSLQAERLLASRMPGDVVIRPSSKGADHLAVTWKVDDGLYQHVDVLEIDKDNEWSLGKMLRVGKATYSDLDELLVSHITPMFRKIEELKRHEKYKGASEVELHGYLRDFVQMNPGKSVYAFCLDRDRPGGFVLGFLANEASQIQNWRGRVHPGAYQLGEAKDLPTMVELCNAFKRQYKAAIEAKRANGGKTPGRPTATPYMGGRTPAVGYPGGKTPDPVPLDPRTPRHPGMGSAQPPPAAYPQQQPAVTSYQQPSGQWGGYAQPSAAQGGWGGSWAAPPPQTHGGWDAPPPPPQQAAYPPAAAYNGGSSAGWGAPPPPPAQGGGAVPHGMNPARAAMIQQAQRGGQGGGGGWDAQSGW